jgi:hypothetical protein
VVYRRIKVTFETRYDVRTQVLWSLVAPRLPAIYGSDIGTLVSSTSNEDGQSDNNRNQPGVVLGLSLLRAGGRECVRFRRRFGESFSAVCHTLESLDEDGPA